MSNSQEFTGTYTQCLKVIEDALLAGVSPMFWGPPGCAKSHGMHAIVKKLGWGMVEERVAQMEAIDLRGIPGITEYGTTRFNPPDELPLKGREKDFPEHGVIFFDEINLSQASDDVRSACFQILDQKRLGGAVLLPGWIPAAAGNQTEYNMMAVELAMPLKNRFVHIFTGPPTVDEWCEWALTHDIDPRIIAFHKSGIQAGLLYKFDAGEYAFPTPRSWAMASDLIKNAQARNESTRGDILRLMSAAIGKAAAVHFNAFIEIVHKCPSLAEILKNPDTTPLPDNQPGLWAVISTIVAQADKKDWEPVIRYIRRVDETAGAPELGIYAFRGITQKWEGMPPSAIKYQDWIGKFRKWG